MLEDLVLVPRLMLFTRTIWYQKRKGRKMCVCVCVLRWVEWMALSHFLRGYQTMRNANPPPRSSLSLPAKYAAEVHGAQLGDLAAPRGIRRVVSPPALLSGPAGEGREHGLVLGFGVLAEILVLQHLPGRGTGVRVQGQEPGEQGACRRR